MNDGQTTGDVDLTADDTELAQQNGDADPWQYEFQLSGEVVSTTEAAHDIHQRQAELQQQQDCDAQKAVEVTEQKRQQHQRIGGA